MFSTIPRIIPSKPSWPTVEVVQANEFKALLFAGAWPCLVGPGWGLAGAWPGLAGAWLAPGPSKARPDPAKQPARRHQGHQVPHLRLGMTNTETRNEPGQNLGQISAFRSEWEPALRKACFMCMMCIICSFRNWPCRLSGNA